MLENAALGGVQIKILKSLMRTQQCLFIVNFEEHGRKRSWA